MEGFDIAPTGRVIHFCIFFKGVEVQPLTSEAMSDENIIVKGGVWPSHFDFIVSLKSGKVIKRVGIF